MNDDASPRILRKVFFSEEKNQKTFALSACPTIEAMAESLGERRD
jgi:hypothetical protein